jgi:hypothetical protein
MKRANIAIASALLLFVGAAGADEPRGDRPDLQRAVDREKNSGRSDPYADIERMSSGHEKGPSAERTYGDICTVRPELEICKKKGNAGTNRDEATK